MGAFCKKQHYWNVLQFVNFRQIMNVIFQYISCKTKAQQADYNHIYNKINPKIYVDFSTPNRVMSKPAKHDDHKTRAPLHNFI